MADKKLFKYSYEGKNHFTYAYDLKQAAVRFKEKLNVSYVNPFDIILVKPLFVYRAWFLENGITKYLYIVARSLKQAWYMFYSEGYTKKQDFSHKNIFVEKTLSTVYPFGIYPEDSKVGKVIAFYD